MDMGLRVQTAERHPGEHDSPIFTLALWAGLHRAQNPPVSDVPRTCGQANPLSAKRNVAIASGLERFDSCTVYISRRSDTVCLVCQAAARTCGCEHIGPGHVSMLSSLDAGLQAMTSAALH